MAGYIALALSYVMSQFFRAFLAVLTPILTAELAMSKVELGMASGMFFLTFAAMQFVIGPMLDKRGARFTAGLLFPVFAGAGALLFASASAGWMVIVAMGLIGIGCAPVLMAAYFLFARHGSAAHYALFTTGFVGLGTLGNVAGTAPLASAIEAFGWRPVVFALGITAIAIGILVAFIVRKHEIITAPAGTKPASYWSLLTMPVLWPMIPIMIIAYMPAAGIRGLWAGPYLTETFGADALAIGRATFFMALAMAIGSFLYGPLEKLFGSAKKVIIFGNIGQLIGILVLALVPLPSIVATAVVFTIIGLFSQTYGLQMAHSRTFMPPELLGRGVTLMNFFSIAGTGVMQFIGGSILEGTRTIAPDAPFKVLFLVYAILLITTLAYFLRAKERPD